MFCRRFTAAETDPDMPVEIIPSKNYSDQRKKKKPSSSEKPDDHKQYIYYQQNDVRQSEKGNEPVFGRAYIARQI